MYWIYKPLEEDVTVMGSWENGTNDLFVLFLTIACESTIISKLKFIKP